MYIKLEFCLNYKPSDFGEEFDLLLMWWLLHSSTANHSLCLEKKIVKKHRK